tara:strand:- start:103 stop:498 length:396 start_codon:yes stop_codon:yes gene_type:complete
MFGEYIPSNSGTVDTLTLSDGRKIEVSAVDGDTPYIVARSNPEALTLAELIEATDGLNEQFSKSLSDLPYLLTNEQKASIIFAKNQLLENKRKIAAKQKEVLRAEHDKTKMFLYGSIALNIGIIAYCAMKK